MPLIIPANSITGGYDVANSLRFNDGSSDYLSRSYSSAGNQKTFTISFWVKRTTLGASQRLFGNYSSANLGVVANFNADDTLQFYNRNTSTGDKALGTNRKFRDSSAFYNIVITVDSTNGTAADRMKIFINGSRETSLSFEYQAPLNYVFQVNDNVTHYIGQRGNSTQYTDGYMSEFVVIDGQALDPTSFGEFDADSGIWKPIDVSGLTFGTNGFYLDFEDSGALGADVSGNGNNFTVNNLTAIDQTTDTPTNNGNTFQPLDLQASTQTLAEGNLKVTTDSGGDWDTVASTIGVTSGKWYFEAKLITLGTNAIIGVIDINDVRLNTTTAYYIGQSTAGCGYQNNGTRPDTGGGFGDSYTNNDIVGAAIDMDNLKVYFSKNGTFQNSGPSGYLSLCTSNLSEVLG
jgi:hypothetical protein